MIKDYIEQILHIVSFVIGFVGILIILVGTVDSFLLYLKKKRNFQKIRYVIGKHILMGLDFLVVKDIIETVFITGNDVKLMDIILLIVIVGVRMALTTHLSKGVKEMHDQIEMNRLKTEHIQNSINDLKNEDQAFEQKILCLEKEELETEKRNILLEQKMEEIKLLLKK